MNAGFDENEAEFGVLIFAVAFEMLPDGDGLIVVSSGPPLEGESERKRDKDATFLINMYRSSGISGARPVMNKSLRQS